MKKIRIFRVSVILLIITLFGLVLSNNKVHAEEKETFNYVSFGASNVNGFGLDGYIVFPDGVNIENITEEQKAELNVFGYERCPEGSYPDLIKDYYSQNYEVEHHQLGMSSMRVEELRVLLDKTYYGDDYTEWRFTGGQNWFSKAEPSLDILREVYANHVTNADLITLDIGVNNFGVFLAHNLFKTGENKFEVSNIDPEIAEYYAIGKAYVKQVLAEAGVSEEILTMISDYNHAIDIAAYALAGYCYNFDIVVNKIYELNPDVKIVVVGIQHLLQDLNVILPGFESKVSLNNITGALVKAANFYISNLSPYAKSYLFADVTENGHVHFFADQLLAWDSELKPVEWYYHNPDAVNGLELDTDIIDCFNLYDNNMYLGMRLKYVLAQNGIDWNSFDDTTKKIILDAAYYPITKIMQDGLAIDFIDLAQYANTSTGPIENALFNNILMEAVESVTIKLNQLQGSSEVYELDLESVYNISGYDESLIQSVAGIFARTSIGNSFFSHPSRQGHQFIADTIINVIENDIHGDIYGDEVIFETLTVLYDLVEKYGTEGMNFIYNKLEKEGIIDELVNEVISIQNKVLKIKDYLETNTIKQLETAKEYINAKIEKFENNPEDAVYETIEELKWVISQLDDEIALINSLINSACSNIANLVEELIDFAKEIAGKPEVQVIAYEVLTRLENMAYRYVEANLDFEKINSVINDVNSKAMILQAKIEELKLEALVLNEEVEMHLAVAKGKAVEIYGKAYVEAMEACGKAEELYYSLLDKATSEKVRLLEELEKEVNDIVNELAVIEPEIKVELEELKLNIETYLVELEANVTAKATEIYEKIVAAYENATSGSYETTEESYYVALGDSATVGESYVDLVANDLHISNYVNLAEKGMRLEDVLFLLNSEIDGDEYFEKNYSQLKEMFISEISKADIITLGFNNIDFTMAQFGSLEPDALDWGHYLPLNTILKVEELLSLVDGELTKALGDFKDVAMTVVSSLLYNYVGSIYNYEVLIEAIETINPNAKVISVGMYNPFINVEFEYEGVEINVGEYMSYLIKAIDAIHFADAFISSNAVVVNLENIQTVFAEIIAEEGLEVEIADFASQLFTNPDAFLPSEAGHEAIAKAILNVIDWECGHIMPEDDGDCTTAVLCPLCGEVLVEAALNHTEVEIPAVPATCANVGYTAGLMCSVCRTILVEPEEVEALEHKYDNACDVDCNECGASRIPADHIYDNRCDDTCNVCGGLRRVLGHVFGNWSVIEEATKKTEGKEGRVCSECGYIEYRAIPVVKGMGAGAVVAIVGGSTVVAGAGGFSIFFFGVKKRKFSDLKNIFKK